MTLQRIGDERHRDFAHILDRRMRYGPPPDPMIAICALEASGHEVFCPSDLTSRPVSMTVQSRRMALCRLELLAFRGLDDEQDRYAQAWAQRDSQAAHHAVSAGASYMALIQLLRSGVPD